MRIINGEVSGKKLVKVLLSVNVGWVCESVGRRGISHFLEHTIFLGNEKYPSPDMDAARYGATLSGETYEDRTIFKFSCLKEDVFQVLDILLSIVFYPLFPEEKVYEEKMSKIIPAIIKESDYYPWELAYEWARNLIFEWDFRYSMGTEEDLKNIGINELRDWHRKYYHSQNTSLLFSEPLNIKEFEIPIGGEKPSRERIKYGKREIVLERRIKNAEIVYGFPIKKYDLKALLLSTILGNYPTSGFWRIFHRDAYMVDSRVEWYDVGGFFFYVGANTRDFTAINQKFKSFIENLTITKEDFEVSKKILSIKLLEKERSSYALPYLLKIDPMLKMGSFKKVLNEVEKIEIGDLLDYMVSILDLEKLKIAVVV